MQTILVPIDGSPAALNAVRYAASLATGHANIEVCLLNVQPPLPTGLHAYLSAEKIEELERTEAENAMQPARAILEASRVPFRSAVRTGPVARTIAHFADQTGCQSIVMGTHGLGRFGTMVIGSITMGVVHLATMPVTLIK